MAFSYNSNNITAVNWNGNSISTVNFNGTEVWTAGPVALEPFYIENRDSSNSVVCQMHRRGSVDAPSLECSQDKTTWTTFSRYTDYTIPASGKLYFRAPTTNYRIGNNDSVYNYFVVSGEYNVGGDITTLINRDGGVTDISSNGHHTFGGLFSVQSGETSNLVDASKLILLPTTLKDSAYAYMFNGCTKLVNPPELPATILTEYCYSGMFLGCTSLKNGPDLPATTLANNCYRGMFQNSILENLKCYFTSWNDSGNSTFNWLYNVNPYTLKLELPDALGSDLTITHDTAHVPEHCVVENNATYSLPLTFSVEDIASLVGTYPALSLQQHGNPGYTPELQYNINGGTWTDYIIGDTLYTTATVGDYIQFRAKTVNTAFSTGGNDGYTFVAEDGMFTVFGNIQSLLDKDMLTDSVPSNAFYGLFMSFNGNVGHVRCPATDLGSWCYAGLFRANADHNFKRAFTDFPALYATERCYQTVYYDCAYLKYVPHFACTSGGPNCFMRTFYNCTSLNVEYFCIPFQSLAYRQCYEMFVNAGTIHKFELMATDIGYDRCLNSLFAASNPLHIKVHFTDWQWDSGFPTDNWVNNIITDTSDCIFECPTALGTQATIDRGSAKCPTNWTVVNF